VVDGVVGPKTWAIADANAKSKNANRFIQAKWYRQVVSRTIDLVVLHTAEVAETLTSAEAVAGFFKNPGNYPDGKPRRVSAHYCVDADSTVQCVLDHDVAFAAPGANANGIQVELSGFARQTAVDWTDAFSKATLARAAKLVARVLKDHKIDCAYVDWTALKRGGARGITTHDDVSRAYGRSSHTDPGKGFPMPAFVEAVRAAV
jgi:N-acetyl-anhydromuramyl-L-alanine amidase AmpD